MAKKTMKFSELSPTAQFMYITCMQLAIRAYESGTHKEKFLSFCEQTWETMKSNDIEDLKEKLNTIMFSKLKKRLTETDE